MAADDQDGLSPEERLQKALEARWDPGKLSKFMSASSSRSSRLDLSQRSRFERRLGVDLGDVRIFTGELAEEITRAHGAEALTVGDTGMILMRQSSAFTPGTAAGTALLAHELTHVAQARPSAISFKKTSSELAEESESEEEAEEHEAEVEAEERGMSGEKSQADKDDIMRRVFEMFEADLFSGYMRLGAPARNE